MITFNPFINVTTSFYDVDNNNVDWNVRYSLTNNSDVLVKVNQLKLDSYVYHNLNKIELIEFHCRAIKLVRILNATNTKFKYRYYLNWFSLIKLFVCGK